MLKDNTNNNISIIDNNINNGITIITNDDDDDIDDEVKDEEMDHGREPQDVPWYRSARTCMAVMSALGYTFFYALRVNLSIALVIMVIDSPPNFTVPLSPHSNTTQNLSNRTETSTFHHPHFTHSQSNLTFKGFGSSLQNNTSPSSGVSIGLDLHTTPNLPTSMSHTVSQSFTEETSDDRSTDNLRDSYCDGTTLNGSTAERNRGEFNWDKEMTGYILSSFFYGYVVTQFPGGWLATKFGAKHIFGGGMFISIVATFLTPAAARTHPYLLIALRVITGFAHGAGFPSTHVLYSLWLPPLERTSYITFAHAGTMAGTILALAVSGFICDLNVDNGWPLIFYIYGMASLVWYIGWNYFVYNTPLDHPRIDTAEKNYIVSKVGRSVYGSARRDKLPWSHAMRSTPVWAIMVAHVCNNWANYTILVCIPLFMKDVLKFDIKQNGILSSLPYLFSLFTAIGSGQLADLLIRKRILTTSQTRKLLQSLSSGVPAALLVVMGHMDCHTRYWAVLLLCLIVSINSLCRAGFMVNHVDIAPRYAGILFGVSNTLATIPGILSSIVVGKLTTNGSREEWLTVFNICAILLAFSCVFYLILADGRLQKWAMPNFKKFPVENGGSQGVRDQEDSPERTNTKM